MYPDATPRQQIESIYRLYASLTSTIALDKDHGIGGKLLWAGDVAGDVQSPRRNLLYAANIAGAASLAASADPAALRQAMRDGVVDFLVTSLEEALRILKNEIRKRLTVSVAVSIDPSILLDEMIDRGVLPDLLPPPAGQGHGESPQLSQFLLQGASQMLPLQEPGRFVTWSVDREFPKWMPRLDAFAHEILPESDLIRKRWVSLAPRYLGRLGQKTHGIVLSVEEIAQFRAHATKLFAGDTAVTLQISGG